MIGRLSASKITGYTHALYARSLGEYGTPLELPLCGGWILKRRIPGWPDYDAMGCYPLFACQDWSMLEADLENVGSQLVSLAIVADPFGQYSPADLRRWFRHVVIPFKEHFIVDLRCSPDTFVSEHHLRNARKALEKIRVEPYIDPNQFFNDWLELYRYLISRHEISGIAAFSRHVFQYQMVVPGLVAFRAEYEGATVGMLLWYVQNDVGYYHLGAYSEKGYAVKASFGLFRQAIDYFAASGLRWLNLGAGVGAESATDSGLSRFKRGWATSHRTAHFCGRIFNRATYGEIAKARGCVATNYFPAYRQGEFS